MSLRERLQRQLFQMGAETQRGALLGRLRGSTPRDTSVIVEHLLYENLMFHHRHFTMALNSLGRSSLWPLAISLLPEMRLRDLIPNTITYNAAVDACRKGHAWECALELFQEMEEAAARADLVTYSTVMSACEKVSNWSQSVHFFARLSLERTPDAACVSGAVTACSRAALWELATSFVEEMRQRQQTPDLHCHNGLITAMGNAKRWQEALNYFAQLPAADVISYNSTIDALSDSHQWQKALEIFDVLKEGSQLGSLSPNIISFNSAIHACWVDMKEDRSELVSQLQAEMRSQRLAPGVRTFCSLISAQSVGSHWQRVLSYLEEMREHDLEPDGETLHTSMELMLKTPDAKQHALQLYKQAEELQLRQLATHGLW